MTARTSWWWICLRFHPGGRRWEASPLWARVSPLPRQRLRGGAVNSPPGLLSPAYPTQWTKVALMSYCSSFHAFWKVWRIANKLTRQPFIAYKFLYVICYLEWSYISNILCLILMVLPALLFRHAVGLPSSGTSPVHSGTSSVHSGTSPVLSTIWRDSSPWLLSHHQVSHSRLSAR